LFSKAWEMGHSSGYSEVFGYASEFLKNISCIEDIDSIEEVIKPCILY
jgi:hypothetical protein